ncbi:tripartite tricarboxylate transporter substrate binding protein [Roseomonas sp. JC162]|uniref:Tripartite tricarboxylate transporter substrate binding protein n=1 Tax=Neoroseomonas marina TaxID=1232220 RepID=A0A848EGP0_9PROT|nr:tripartite tricarboxylate transporter substrate-binding protein [Neoroseomonas marina]NMJ42538.1 tripartite tricarboxylate transporter substrate binding protein [Neoroseomonas marina]
MIRLPRRSLLATPLAGLAAPALAQSPWPTRPVRIVVPFGTGGGTDVTTRLLAPKMAEILGQPVVIENRPGAGGVVGTDYVAKLPPNGEAFVLSTLSPIALARGLPAPLPFDARRDLVAVAPTVFVPIALAVTTRNFAPRTAAEFVATMKAAPNRYQYGSSGIGTSGHIASASFCIRTGTEAVHVPYRGGGQVFAALTSGEIQFCCDIPSLLKGMHEGGQARVLFVATEQRSSLLPEVPTAVEAGITGYKAYSWYGFFAPAGTPQPIVDRMAAATEQALSDPAIAGRFEDMGTPAMRGYTPARFAQYVRDEIAFWEPEVRGLGITE